MPNKFIPENHYDFKIVNSENLVVGHLRIKPSGIHWKPRNAKKWYGITLEKLAKVAEKGDDRKTK